MSVGYVRAVSTPEHANPAAGPGLRVGGWPHDAAGTGRGAESGTGVLSRLGISRWSAPAWGAIGAAAAFIAVTCWWLTQDRSIPIYDAGDQLETALEYHNMLQSGNLLGPFTHETVYPILGHMVGALAAFVGGVNVASPIIGENLVFIPLLALGCYQTGRLLFGGLAGMLAVVFALGSSLLISLFHVFMLDGPLTALIAVAVWLILASEDFSRPGVAAIAGLAVGLGLNIKVQFTLYIVGLLAVVVLHGGWRNRRGLTAFAAVAAVVGLPWYVVHFSELGRMLELASAGPGTPPGNIPARFSTDNLTWYFWSVLNSQLLAPLFVLAFAGTVWTAVTVVRERARQPARLEFLVGGVAAWLVITFVTIHHDIRYGLPLLAFASVLATGWIAHLPRTARLAAIALLVLGVSANILAIDFGVGGEAKIALAQVLPSTEQVPDRIVLYSTNGFLSAAPSRDGDVPGLLQALRHHGVSTVAVSAEQGAAEDFSFEGLKPLAMIAQLTFVVTNKLEYIRSASAATLVHEAVRAGTPSACTRLSDGTGVWVVRYDTVADQLAFYCPERHPQYYGVGGAVA
jgi:hypothetical protein